MALDVADTVKSAFSDIFSVAGLVGIVGPIVLAVLWGLAIGLFTVGGTLGVILGLAGVLVALAATVSFGVGIFRVFRNLDFKTEYFTENFALPGFRMIVSNLIFSLFSSIAFYLLLIPMLLLGGGIAALAAGSTPSSMMGAGIIGILLFLVALGISIYVQLSMILSIPIIPTEDKRAFQALDEAVQRSKGNRARMFLALLPAILLGVIGYAVMLLLDQSLLGVLVYLALVAVAALYNVSLLNQFASRLE